ncbi:hypothetical protein [Umezawaea sp. Da 62-37]|uniref:hypothetical protein n=1 Tax=Umezawaea sp. Da 62-37 TaxID=3075927 RepID=UPI0028F714FA|nr:hypothetical protein [Umezawaea sp. Da 62-37]WNV87959.1 hypothetical protein RM788_06635 [Umezawaea sp. Da 62-37]
MSELFVLGLGGHSGSRTFVPFATTVVFHPVRGPVTAPSLRDGRVFPFGEGDEPDNDIPNYVLTAPVAHVAEVEQFARTTPAGSTFVIGSGDRPPRGAVPLVPVLDGLPLCTVPAECFETWPLHGPACGGLFNLLPPGTAVLHLVCGVVGRLFEAPEDAIGDQESGGW